jgi:hypothetical protein
MTEYTIAALCKRGHLMRLNAEVPPELDPEFCPTCGGLVIWKCTSCDAEILGVEHSTAADIPGAASTTEAFEDLDTAGWERPAFCYVCGSPFPWIDRQGRIHHLENLLEREIEDEGTALALREQLEALADPNLDDKTAERHWRRIRELAPEVWENTGARAVATSLMTAYLKHVLKLDVA